MTPKEKPLIHIPSGPPPLDLTVEDIDNGSGIEAIDGATVTVHYVGMAWSTRAEFDSSWDRGSPLTFTIGKGRVIAGWDRGIVGMRVGGRRQLVIPPHLGYGSAGSGLFIKPNETLVFILDLTEMPPIDEGPRRRRLGRLFGG